MRTGIRINIQDSDLLSRISDDFEASKCDSECPDFYPLFYGHDPARNLIVLRENTFRALDLIIYLSLNEKVDFRKLAKEHLNKLSKFSEVKKKEIEKEIQMALKKRMQQSAMGNKSLTSLGINNSL